MKRLVLFGAVVLAFAWAGCRAEEYGDRQSGEDVALAVPPYTQREGAVLFAHYCAPCHGVEGAGDGFNAFNLEPKPRDLTSEEFQTSRSDDDLAAVIRLGGRAAGLSTSMPPWGQTLNERQIRAIVEFTRTLHRESVDAGETL